MKIVEEKAIDNPAEATAFLKSETLNLKGELTGDVYYNGPYYPEFLQAWVLRQREMNQMPKLIYTVVDGAEVTAAKAKVLPRKLEQRFAVKYDDGTEGIRYKV